MDEIEKLAAEIETANPVRKMMLAQQLLPLIVAELKRVSEDVPSNKKVVDNIYSLHVRVACLESVHAAR